MSCFSRFNLEIRCIIPVKYNPVIDTGAPWIIRWGHVMHLLNYRYDIEQKKNNREGGMGGMMQHITSKIHMIVWWPGCDVHFLAQLAPFDRLLPRQAQNRNHHWTSRWSSLTGATLVACRPGRPLNWFYWLRNLVWPGHWHWENNLGPSLTFSWHQV